MHTGGLSAKETVLCHSKEMNELFKHDYIGFARENEQKIDNLYRQIIEKEYL
jgi:hypothetical protein